VEPLSGGGEVVQFKKKKRLGNRASASSSTSSLFNSEDKSSIVSAVAPVVAVASENIVSELEEGSSMSHIHHEMVPHKAVTGVVLLLVLCFY